MTVRCGKGGNNFSADKEWTGGGGGEECHTEVSTFDDSIGKLVGVQRRSKTGGGGVGGGGGDRKVVNLTTTYSYDEQGRIKATNTNVGHNQEFEYDLNSNLTSVRGTNAGNFKNGRF